MDFQRKYFDRSGFGRQIQQHLGNAKDLIPELKHRVTTLSLWTLIKLIIINYLELVLPKMHPGGVIISDNVLWSGKVTQEAEVPNDKDTQVLQEYQ